MSRRLVGQKAMTPAQRARRSRELAATVFMETDDLSEIATGRLAEMLPANVNRGAESFVVAINKELLRRVRANKR